MTLEVVWGLIIWGWIELYFETMRSDWQRFDSSVVSLTMKAANLFISLGVFFLLERLGMF